MSAWIAAQPTLPRRAISGPTSLVIHEFRVPVHTLHAYLGVLLAEQIGPITETQRDFLESMTVVVRRLERLTNDIEVISADDDTFPIVVTDVDLLEIVERCCWELQPLANSFNVSIELEPSAGKSWTLRADPIRLAQIVLNLLDNAIRYSGRSSIISVRLRQSTTRVEIIVENEPAELIQQTLLSWFTPFVRGPNSYRAHPHGAGLGLVVVAQLVAAHRGRIFARARGPLMQMAAVLPR